MIQIVNFIIENWKLLGIIAAVILIFSITGPVTSTLRGAKQGIKEATTPLGMIVFIILVVLVMVLLNKLGGLFE